MRNIWEDARVEARKRGSLSNTSRIASLHHQSLDIETAPKISAPNWCTGRWFSSVLSQTQDGKGRVIGYAHGLAQSERWYLAHKLELLALKWTVVGKLNDYLCGHKFTVITDNNSLTYVLATAKRDATGHWWLAALAAYDFNIKYQPAVQNTVTDALSRLPKRQKTTKEARKIWRESNRDRGVQRDDQGHDILSVQGPCMSKCWKPVFVNPASGHQRL